MTGKIKLGVMKPFRPIYVPSFNCSQFSLLSLSSGEETVHFHFCCNTLNIWCQCSKSRRQDITSIIIGNTRSPLWPLASLVWILFCMQCKVTGFLSRAVTIWFMFLNVSPAAKQQMEKSWGQSRSREMITYAWLVAMNKKKVNWLEIHLRGKTKRICLLMNNI